jgi:hypothetical protein
MNKMKNHYNCLEKDERLSYINIRLNVLEGKKK